VRYDLSVPCQGTEGSLPFVLKPGTSRIKILSHPSLIRVRWSFCVINVGISPIPVSDAEGGTPPDPSDEDRTFCSSTPEAAGAIRGGMARDAYGGIVLLQQQEADSLICLNTFSFTDYANIVLRRTLEFRQPIFKCSDKFMSTSKYPVIS
jgi:hypothetical protein